MEKLINVSNQGASLHTSRRNFLKLGGIGLLTTSLFLAGCSDNDDIMDLPVAMFSI